MPFTQQGGENVEYYETTPPPDYVPYPFYQPKPNESKVNNVSIQYDDLINALPLPGLRVILNPEKEKNYMSKLKSISGTIIDKCGDIEDVQRIIRGMKEKGFTTDSWYVVVKFDELGNHEIHVRDLILIGNTSEVVHEVRVKDGSTMHLNENEYQEKMDEHLIQHGRKITLHNIWNDEFRRKIFEEA